FVPVPGTKILMCTTETTVAQYQAAGMEYQPPRFPQGSDHPAVNVSWNDAKAWCAWLSRKEGRKYRLPTDAEWSAAVGTNTYPWGNHWPPPKNSGNYMGQEHKGSVASVDYFRSIMNQSGFWSVIGGFRDQHVFTAPVGSYPANACGLYDLGGNLEEWCEDWFPDYQGKFRVRRDFSWGPAGVGNVGSANFESSNRGFGTPDLRSGYCGFRCVAER
ncbi:MAG: SUMF1/EgtB/PvdO family nonheme iron enzyme, partial [Verrucomicrobiales bacterium]|nr:SUMF1/EgtB/PvdO family nonheme iron enzyme [Verrucomicrobiales bacterium]